MSAFQLSLFAAPSPRFCVRSTEGDVLCATFVEAANVARSCTQRGIKATVSAYNAKPAPGSRRYLREYLEG